MKSNLKQRLHPISLMLVRPRKRLRSRETLSIHILAGAAHNSQMRLRRRRPKDSEEAQAISIAPAREHNGKRHGLAGPIFGARDVEPLRLAYQSGPKLMPLGHFVVEDCHGSEHELLEGGPRWELGAIKDGESRHSSDEVVAVAIVLPDVRRKSTETREEGDVVVVHDSSIGVVGGEAVVHWEDGTVGLGEGDLPPDSWVGHNARHGNGGGVGPAKNVVHEEGEGVVIRDYSGGSASGIGGIDTGRCSGGTTRCDAGCATRGSGSSQDCGRTGSGGILIE